ncbi:MAG: HEAT repeat domain-containing protein [Polyangiaceae bacterium]
MNATGAVEISRALASSDPEERRRAVSQIASLAIGPAVPLVLAALGDSDWRVRKEATVAGRAFLPEEALIRALIEALRTAEVGLCNAAVDVLGAAGAAATPLLAEALETLDADGRKLAVEALGRGRDRGALTPLARALDDADPNVRQAAAESIATLAGVAPEAVESVLLGLLGDGDPIVRLSALSGLDTLGASIPWDKLAPLLDDPTLRPLALAAVARAGHAGAPAVLARALGASSGRTFDAALSAFALVPLDPLPEPAFQALTAHTPDILDRLLRAARSEHDEHPERKRTALLVGATLGDARMVEVAIAALGEAGLGNAALAALEWLGAPAMDALVQRLDREPSGARTDDDDERTLYVDALAYLAEREILAQEQRELPRGAYAKDAPHNAALPAVRRVARGRSPRASARALHALGSLGEAEDLALVEAIFLSSEGAVAYAAEAALSALASRHQDAAHALAAEAESVAQRGRAAAVILGALAEANALDEEEPRALRFLSAAAVSQDAPTRRSAAAALSKLGGSAAIEALVYALADEEREVRRTAARGLGRLAAAKDDAKLLGVVRASGDPELLAAAVRSAGDVLSARPDEGAASARLFLGLDLRHSTGRPPPSRPPPPASGRLVAALAGLCEDPSPDVATAALDSLRRAPPDVPGRVEAMSRALEHPDVNVVKTAFLKLAALLGASLDDVPQSSAPPLSMPEARPPVDLADDTWERLRRILDHDLAELRILAAECLCGIDSIRGRDALVERARVERDPDVLTAIDAALSAAPRPKKGGAPP